MGVKLIILLALLVGVLYCLHLLVQDYQALNAGPRLLRLLFKRDVSVGISSINNLMHGVRWRMILQHDPIQCARYLYCELGASRNHTEMQRGFVYMLTLEPREEDKTSRDVFVEAYHRGNSSKGKWHCRNMYPYCPFDYGLLLEFVQYLISSHA